MKKTILFLVVFSFLISCFLPKESILYARSPISPIPYEKPLPKISKRNSGISVVYTLITVTVQPKQEHYKIVGMYDNMLKAVQHKRLWPIDIPRYDNCIMLHNKSWICP